MLFNGFKPNRTGFGHFLDTHFPYTMGKKMDTFAGWGYIHLQREESFIKIKRIFYSGDTIETVEHNSQKYNWQ